ncbi:MAG: signal peptidase I [Solirubrobacterales bacterium]|nr:signal peptidase I [Solirubrobacterales bacterium]
MARPAKRKSALSSFIELVVTIAIAVGVAILIQAFVVKPYRIPSSSMEPTLDIDQRVLVNRLTSTPSLGDIVVFHPPQGADPIEPVCGDAAQGSGHLQACDSHTRAESEDTYIKRLVGLPGDRIRIVDGHVIRNGRRENDAYIRPCGNDSSCNFPRTITIPPGEYFMMGDNREVSDDSRFWGPVPGKWIIGVAFFTYWPPGRFGTL